ncbi:hypothetical protein HDU98_006181 [Podochytrium sp. JEL0797]|nr:hypothetical protein HDU98_006181 [Podochytrium sp. JEL0797]
MTAVKRGMKKRMRVVYTAEDVGVVTGGDGIGFGGGVDGVASAAEEGVMEEARFFDVGTHAGESEEEDGFTQKRVLESAAAAAMSAGDAVVLEGGVRRE